jgi:hypothetical protein
MPPGDPIARRHGRGFGRALIFHFRFFWSTRVDNADAAESVARVRGIMSMVRGSAARPIERAGTKRPACCNARVALRALRSPARLGEPRQGERRRSSRRFDLESGEAARTAIHSDGRVFPEASSLPASSAALDQSTPGWRADVRRNQPSCDKPRTGVVRSPQFARRDFLKCPRPSTPQFDRTSSLASYC